MILNRGEIKETRITKNINNASGLVKNGAKEKCPDNIA